MIYIITYNNKFIKFYLDIDEALDFINTNKGYEIVSREFNTTFIMLYDEK